MKKKPAPSEVVPRTLPSNLEAERSVLGAILIENTALLLIAETLSAKDFFRDAHRRIFSALVWLIDHQQVADLVTLKERLETLGDLDECGGPVYIASLVDGVPRSTNVQYYAGIVREKALLRSIIFTGNAAIASAYEADLPPLEILRAAEESLFELQVGHQSSRMAKVGAGIPAMVADLDWHIQNRGALTGFTTGFPSIDKHSSGWQRGDLVVLAARPSIGKTAFLLNAIIAACRAGHKAAVFSLEMRLRLLERRIVSSLSDVPMERIRSGELAAGDALKIQDAYEVLHDLPLWIDDTAGRTAQDVRSACRRLKAEEGLDIVAIDYVQLMKGSLGRPGASRNDEVTDISRRLKLMADELECTVILLSQLSRAGDKRPDPRPKLSDLRESGALEQDADVVGFLHRKNHREGGLTYFIIEKERNGPTGTLKLDLDRDVSLFKDAPDLEEPAPPAPAPKKIKAGKPARLPV